MCDTLEACWDLMMLNLCKSMKVWETSDANLCRVHSMSSLIDCITALKDEMTDLHHLITLKGLSLLLTYSYSIRAIGFFFVLLVSTSSFWMPDSRATRHMNSMHSTIFFLFLPKVHMVPIRQCSCWRNKNSRSLPHYLDPLSCNKIVY